MEEIQYKKLDADCFNTHSLDSFVRHQAVTECWREAGERWIINGYLCLILLSKTGQ